LKSKDLSIRPATSFRRSGSDRTTPGPTAADIVGQCSNIDNYNGQYPSDFPSAGVHSFNLLAFCFGCDSSTSENIQPEEKQEVRRLHSIIKPGYDHHELFLGCGRRRRIGNCSNSINK
jgi:hypothetical protein